jgi:hypothetical protein
LRTIAGIDFSAQRIRADRGEESGSAQPRHVAADPQRRGTACRIV